MRATRDVEIEMKELSLNDESREVGAPIVKEEDKRGSEKALDRNSARQYRGIIARVNHLGQDRSQIHFAVKDRRQGAESKHGQAH